MRQMCGKLVCCMGIVRTTFALNLKAVSYNLQRLVFLKQRGLPAIYFEGQAAKLGLRSDSPGRQRVPEWLIFLLWRFLDK
ncbi:hypothetical protein SAMN04515618_12033 [Collimonas sp. OK307]|nr:hypothetical protein SAMN04515618_12033 [Collimonas sp. OK307]